MQHRRTHSDAAVSDLSGSPGAALSPPTLSFSAVSSRTSDSAPPLASSMSPARARHESVVAPEGYKNTKRYFSLFFFFFFFFCESQFYLTFVLCFLSLQRAIITINKAGVIVSCNNAARFLFGYPLGLMVGGRVERLMAPSFAASHQSHVDAAAAQTAQGTFTGKWKLKEAVGLNLII